MPFFSVVIPTYNRAGLLPAAIDSVLGQEFPDYEILCVDDGSTDGTREALRPYQGRVRVLTQERSGPGAARNYGVEHAKGDYVAFLDSDDLWFPWTLATAKRIIEDTGSPSLLLGRLLPFRDGEHRVHVPRDECAFTAFPDYLDTAQYAHWISGSAIVVRRSAFYQAGGFVREFILAEELDLTLRLGTAPVCVHLHAPYFGAYRRHEGSAVSDSRRIYLGIRYLIEQERRGGYPGGPARRRQRRRILARHIRAASVRLLSARRWREAWSLYRSSFPWQLAEWRWKYLTGFPVIDLRHRLRSPGAARDAG